MRYASYESVDKCHLIIIDYEWYAPLTDEIDAWCVEVLKYRAREGMVLTFVNEQDRILFLITWL